MDLHHRRHPSAGTTLLRHGEQGGRIRIFALILNRTMCTPRGTSSGVRAARHWIPNQPNDVDVQWKEAAYGHVDAGTPQNHRDRTDIDSRFLSTTTRMGHIQTLIQARAGRTAEFCHRNVCFE